MEKKKKGLNIRTSTKNGVKTKSVECSYGIKTEDGQRFTAILNRMESSDGNQGIISFIIRDNVSLAPQGTLRSISQCISMGIVPVVTYHDFLYYCDCCHMLQTESEI